MRLRDSLVGVRPSRILLLKCLLWSLYFASWVAATKQVDSQRAWNLDGLFYSALMHPGGAPAAVVHQRVYAEIEAHVPSDAAAALTQASDYRQRLHDSVELFDFQLPFYAGKPLYVWFGKVFTTFGVASIVAPYKVSALGYAALGLLLPWLAIRAGARPLVAAALAAGCAWLPELRDLGSLATPDALATAFLVLGAALSLSGFRYALLPLTAAVLTRPDAAIFACGVVLAAGVSRPAHGKLRAAMLASLLLLGTAWAGVALTGAYPWPTVMRHTFMDRVLDAHDRALGFSMSDYIVALDRGLHGHMTDHPARFAPYLGVALLSLGWASRHDNASNLRPAVMLLCGAWLATAAHFLVLPLLADRFFASAYVCTLGLSCALLFPARRSADQPSAEAASAEVPRLGEGAA